MDIGNAVSNIGSQGLLGSIILVLGGVVWYLYREIKVRDENISILQDKRLTDSNQYALSFTGVAKEMVAANRDSVNATVVMQKSLDSITQALQALANNK